MVNNDYTTFASQERKPVISSMHNDYVISNYVSLGIDNLTLYCTVFPLTNNAQNFSIMTSHLLSCSWVGISYGYNHNIVSIPDSFSGFG